MMTVAIIQARMGSSRLPGKVMKKLMGRTVLSHVIERISRVKAIDIIVVATSELETDDPIVKEAVQWGAEVYRGSELDVLSRYYEAALAFRAETVVRITSDCPLIDPEVVSEVIQAFIQTKADYASNSLDRSYPRGLDLEVFTIKALTEANALGVKPEQREHVTAYIYQNPDKYKLFSYRMESDFSQYRWTLDTFEDWILIQEIYQRLYHSGDIFSWHSVLKLMNEHPELPLINAHIEQKKLGQ